MEQVNKNYFISLHLLIVITLFTDSSLAGEFSYMDEASWPLKYPQCGGQRQSPVSLEYRDLDEANSNVTFPAINYHKKPSSAKLMNIGHTIKVEFEWDENETPFFTGDVFGGKEYVLDSMNFRWSRVSSQGSEHIIFGKGGAMEMHLVHYNRNYGSFENASNFNDGLAIVGALFNTNAQRRRRNIDFDYENLTLAASQKSPAVSYVLSNTGSVKTPGSSVDIEPFAITDVLPIQLEKLAYILYFGSLAIPPCTENVLRLMIKFPFQITEEQLEYLQSTVELDHGDDHNNRPVQSMNGRKFSIVWGVADVIN